MKQNLTLQVGVKTFLVNNKKMILCLKRNSSAHTSLDSKWDIPGGRIDSHETLEQGLKREIKEETGIDSFKNLALLAVQDIFGFSNKHVIRITYVSRVTKSNVSLSEEHQEYKWVTLKDLLKLDLEEYIRDIIKDKKHMSFIKNLIK